jgi:hypothetical protein
MIESEVQTFKDARTKLEKARTEKAAALADMVTIQLAREFIELQAAIEAIDRALKGDAAASTGTEAPIVKPFVTGTPRQVP